MLKRQDIYRLCLAALFVAMQIAATRLLGFNTPDGLIRISPNLIVVGLSGWVLGPAWAMGVAMTGDLLGFALFPSPFAIIPLITVAMGLRGFIYGAFLYKREVSALRNYAAIWTEWLVCSMFLTTFALSQAFGNPFWAVLSTRVIPSTIMMIVSMVSLTVLMHALKKPLAYMGGTLLHES